MTYTNVLYTHGYAKFMSRAKNAGIDGLILPDMSIEESKDYLKSARKNKLDTIFLVSPNTNNARLKKIAKASTGFLYMVAVFGEMISIPAGLLKMKFAKFFAYTLLGSCGWSLEIGRAHV